jgi:hypothetical protein
MISAVAEAIEEGSQLKRRAGEHDTHWENASWWARDTHGWQSRSRCDFCYSLFLMALHFFFSLFLRTNVFDRL